MLSYSLFIKLLCISLIVGVYRAEASDLSADLCIKKRHIREYIHKYLDASEFKKPVYSSELQAFYETKIKPSNNIDHKHIHINSPKIFLINQ